MSETKNVQKPASETKPWIGGHERPFVRIKGVSKHFGDFSAVDNVSQDIYKGELFALLGGSGSGKSTLLRMIAGLETPSAGRIEIDGEDMRKVRPYARPVNMMFQSYALFPHMNVAKNIAYGLRCEGMAAASIKERVAELLALVRLEDFAQRKPHQLSGGQRQRVALARALAKRPKLLLLDEPLGALDKKLREDTQFELVRIQEQLGITFIVVTHDQEEAMTLATRIAVMDRGQISQVGEPVQVYNYPGSRFVADFIGSTNIFKAQVGKVAAGAQRFITFEGQDFTVAGGSELDEGQEIHYAVRPEAFRVLHKSESQEISTQKGGDNQMSAVIEDIAFLGNRSVFLLKLASGRKIKATRPNRGLSEAQAFTWDQEVVLRWDISAGVILSET